MILKIHPDLKDIYVITDNRTATAVETKKVFMEAAGKLKPGKRIIFMENFPLDILLKKIRMIPPSGSVIFMLNFNKDINHIYISNEDAIELVSENSPVPAYGTCRITSYNVCYTKLLRVHDEIQSSRTRREI